MVRLTRAQVREIDRRAIRDFHIPGIVLMENAARSAADVAWQMVGAQPARFVTIFCGPGNNGGDGLAVARHMHNRGTHVEIVPVFDPAKLASDALTNWRIVEAMRLELVPLDEAEDALARQPELVIDALLGTGFTGEPRDAIARAIDLINRECKSPVLAIDVPSGLDCDTGQPAGLCIRATTTVTFVAEKSGFINPAAKPFLGRIVVGDIGCPAQLLPAQ
ncbi:MAG: NAD(P)H-hydrate epimerase [Anaerolineae bacterium]|nr:NAD(P)H-hydrate epimerase [Phycisphaerae bacterium]